MIIIIIIIIVMLLLLLLLFIEVSENKYETFPFEINGNKCWIHVL